MAVKVTLSPEQIESALAAIVTLAGRDGLAVMVMALDVSGEPVAHAKDEVMIQATTSPSFNVVVEYVTELVPTFPPFTCH